MSTCLKTFSLEVVSEEQILAWFPFEEAVDPRVDAVHGAQMVLDFSINATRAAGAGKVGNALRLQSASNIFSLTMDTPAGTVSPSAPLMADGFSYVFWIKRDQFLNADQIFLGTPMDVPGDYFNLIFVWEQAPSFISITCENSVDSFNYRKSFFPVTLGDWYFFHIFWKDGTFGYQINNGAENLSPDALFIGDTPTLMYPRCGFHCNTAVAGNSDLSIDEWAISGKKFTPAQLTYLYNAGAGRTWPVTLP